MSNILYIINPAGHGGAGKKVWERMQSTLPDRIDPDDVHFTERQGHAREIAAAAEGYDIVAAVGGDGTVGEVLSGIMALPELEQVDGIIGVEDLVEDGDRRRAVRVEEAHQILVETYNWFTEGFDTADLKDAKALLEELAEQGVLLEALADEVGADFVVLGGKSGDPYAKLIAARESTVALVVINGVRRYGQARFLRGIDGVESRTVANASPTANAICPMSNSAGRVENW